MKTMLIGVLAMLLVAAAYGCDDCDCDGECDDTSSDLDIDGDGDGDSDGDSDDDCSDREALLEGVWITPEGSSTSSSSFNTLTYTVADHSGHVYMYSYGHTMIVDFTWELVSLSANSCDRINVDYGYGWESAYSVIHELSETKLDLEATDGSYYGQRTRYDRLSDGGESATCQQPCYYDSDCSPAEACLNAESGMICLPFQCTSCWNYYQSCYYNPVACTFSYCE